MFKVSNYSALIGKLCVPSLILKTSSVHTASITCLFTHFGMAGFSPIKCLRHLQLNCFLRLNDNVVFTEFYVATLKVLKRRNRLLDLLREKYGKNCGIAPHCPP